MNKTANNPNQPPNLLGTPNYPPKSQPNPTFPSPTPYPTPHPTPQFCKTKPILTSP